MVDCIFSSVHGGSALKKAVLSRLDTLLSYDSNTHVLVSLFAFSLTDEAIADKILSIAKTNTNIHFKIIADWSQRGIKGNKQLHRLSQSEEQNLEIRYKLDQPYIKGDHHSRIQWSYRKSTGLLHHKTLCITQNGQFECLILGSFNWTKRATTYYENLLILFPETSTTLNVFRKFQLEFDAMWNDNLITASPAEASRHFNFIKEKLNAPVLETPLFDEYTSNYTSSLNRPANNSNHILLAFNSKGFQENESRGGYHPENHYDRFILTKPSGKEKSVPLTINNLALDIIFNARAGDTLKMASYALSPKAPEFGALIEAARRNVEVHLLLDNRINFDLADFIERKYSSLPIWVRTTSKRLHSKYIIHEASNSVLTGTANFTQDASYRHTEHRLLIRNNQAVTSAFLKDFQTIWERVKKREKDKPRLFLSNNGNDALDIPYNKNKIPIWKNQTFSHFFLFLCHQYLHIRYYWWNNTVSSNPLPLQKLLYLIEQVAYSKSYSVYLIGSYIDYIKGIKEKHSSDIDLYICPKKEENFNYRNIEQFLLWIKNLGLKHNISFDLICGALPPNRHNKVIPPDLDIEFVKLFSPYLKNKVIKGKIKKYNFLGRYLIQFSVQAKDTTFFNKLPLYEEDTTKKILRGSIELTSIL